MYGIPQDQIDTLIAEGRIKRENLGALTTLTALYTTIHKPRRRPAGMIGSWSRNRIGRR